MIFLFAQTFIYCDVKKGVPALVSVTVLPSEASSSLMREFMQEVATNIGLKHPNIVAVKGVSLRNRPWLAIHEVAKVRHFFVFRLKVFIFSCLFSVQFGNLKTLLGALQLKKITVSTREHCNIARQLCAALLYLSDNNFLHSFVVHTALFLLQLYPVFNKKKHLPDAVFLET